MHIQGIQGSRWATAVIADSSSDGGAGPVSGAGGGHGATRAADGGSVRGSRRTTPLRVDAQRNLEHVLRAAREVFGELGYGAPMEDVARRARVGVGTVYRRFPSKDVLVRRIAQEETARLTEQAREALGQEEEPWSALSRFLRTSVDSGAGRLLPPRILRVGSFADGPGGAAEDMGAGPGGERTPQGGGHGQAGLRLVDGRAGQERENAGSTGSTGSTGENENAGNAEDDAGVCELLDVVGRLVERAQVAGELRSDVTVADILLVIATAAPSLPNAMQQAAASVRLLDILLEGLRPRYAKPVGV
ncbi:TetR/AcrR family transcriptional regulator [Streptomyces verrucosisporus]|uniref:TetR/AcrR family transcriptional regulator n=1 Tax=Streptomyces verrucosisporus TaxID=1695161 RepID=UPI0019CFB566|nr:TetR/AcrR family transcriptional regulator [Streptomyces verrucosisporus]MBN3932070.1 TetR/AcrR family transcriptional regulator [Streptomyces verrucosisporus]